MLSPSRPPMTLIVSGSFLRDRVRALLLPHPSPTCHPHCVGQTRIEDPRPPELTRAMWSLLVIQRIRSRWSESSCCSVACRPSSPRH